MSDKIASFFSSSVIDRKAKESGFINRKRKFTGNNFLETLFCIELNTSEQSLNGFAEEFTFNGNQIISKQAVCKRFSKEAVLFLKCLLEDAIKQIFIEDKIFSTVESFDQIIVKDSTSFRLPDGFEEKYKGCKSNASRSVLKIQFEYELKSGKILEIELHSYTDTDIVNSLETKDKLVEGSLIIRDLGYISRNFLIEVKKKEAFFISRLINNAVIFDKKEDLNQLTYDDLYKLIKKRGVTVIDKEVYITNKKEKVRIIIELLPDEIVNERLRKAKLVAKRKRYTLSNEYKKRAMFNIFITNISKDVITTQDVHQLYKFRWQIELIFKSFKSTFKINSIKKMKIERFEVILYSKLLLIVINWAILCKINQYIFNSKDKLISLNKCFKFISKQRKSLINSIKHGTDEINSFIKSLIYISSHYHLLEKKKGKSSFYSILEM